MLTSRKDVGRGRMVVCGVGQEMLDLKDKGCGSLRRNELY